MDRRVAGAGVDCLTSLVAPVVAADQGLRPEGGQAATPQPTSNFADLTSAT
jgi:hypothetical protein